MKILRVAAIALILLSDSVFGDLWGRGLWKGDSDAFVGDTTEEKESSKTDINDVVDESNKENKESAQRELQDASAWDAKQWDGSVSPYMPDMSATEEMTEYNRHHYKTKAPKEPKSPSKKPRTSPTKKPRTPPTKKPTKAPTKKPTNAPTKAPTKKKKKKKKVTRAPTQAPKKKKKKKKKSAPQFTYLRITVTNLAYQQPFSPFFVMVHDECAPPLFTLGERGTGFLAALAERGDPEPLVEFYEMLPGVLSADAFYGYFPPYYGGGPPAEIVVKVNHAFPYVTIASMATNTNDAFIAINGNMLKGGEHIYLPGLDAGTAFNSEDCDDVPGSFCQGKSNGATQKGMEEGFVHVHGGIHGIADLVPSLHDWRNPMALVSVEKIYAPDCPPDYGGPRPGDMGGGGAMTGGGWNRGSSGPYGGSTSSQTEGVGVSVDTGATESGGEEDGDHVAHVEIPITITLEP